MMKQMTLEQKYDRLERIAQLLYRAADIAARKSRDEVRVLRKRLNTHKDRGAKH
jgi:hypothetical protein